MNSNKEKKRVRIAKIRYFFAAMCIYIAVYLFLALVLKIIQSIFWFSPVIEIVLLVVFFFLSAKITKRLVRIRLVANWVTLD